MLHFLVVTDIIPNIYHGGGGVTSYAAVMALRKNAHKVTILALSPSKSNHNDKSDEDYIKEFEFYDISVSIINQNQENKPSFFSILYPSLGDVFSGFNKRKWISEKVREIKPDAILTYHWDALASTYSITGIPKFGLVGDPIHLPFLYRKEFISRMEKSVFSIRSFKLWVLEKTQIRRMQIFMDKLLNECNMSGAFAAHHAKEFIDRGIQNCHYFRTPTPDSYIAEQRMHAPKANKFKILHIGHLQGISTLNGVELLAYEIIPALDRMIGAENYEVHLVGGYFETMPRGLKQALTRSNVKVRGQVTPADNEFLSSHIVLVPIPIELGIRVRIISAFSYGSCIVAHLANKKGIPELENNINCLLGSSGKEIADMCVKIYKDDQLRQKLEFAARKTYDEYFSLDVAGKAISDALVSLVKDCA